MFKVKKHEKLVLSGLLRHAHRHISSENLPFQRIPSPPAHLLMGHSFLFSKNGPYKKEKFTEAVADLSAKYGPIFTLKFPGQQLVITTDAENAFKLFQHEEKYPVRFGLAALEYYHKKTFNTTGVVSGNGEVWYKFRKCLVPLLTKSYISKFNSDTHDIAQSFVRYIRNCRNEKNVMFDVCSHLYKYSTECISIICPGKRLRCIDDDNYFASKIINANGEFMDGMYGTFSEPPIWRFFKTKSYKKLENSCGVIAQYIDSEVKKPLNEWENSFMKKLFENPNLSQNEARLLSIEVFLGGIDAVATTIALALHYLANDNLRQEIAFQEASNYSDSSQSYLKACLKETLRLSSTAGGTSRITSTDLIMNGYQIPANTAVIISHSASSTMEKYFEDANSFIPERWLNRGKTQFKDPFSPYASLPFGYGSRVCPGRWLSEQEFLALLIEILKEFILVSETQSPVDMIYRMNRIPERPITIKFIDRVKS